MPGILLDTHAAVWYLTEPDKLSSVAAKAVDEAISIGSPLYVSAISLVEIVYLCEKGRINESAAEKLIDAILDASVFTAVSVDVSIVKSLRRVSREAIPDMPDRIIGATGLALNAAIITMDKKLSASSIPTIW